MINPDHVEAFFRHLKTDSARMINVLWGAINGPYLAKISALEGANTSALAREFGVRRSGLYCRSKRPDKDEALMMGLAKDGG